MTGFVKTSNFMASFIIYITLSIIVIIAGLQIVHHSKNVAFYNHFLLSWESTINQSSTRDILYPQFNGKNHVEYMDTLVKLIDDNAIALPKSNTPKPYVYKLSTEPLSEKTIVFLLYLNRKIILYGLPKTTMNMLDKNIDGKVNLTKGKFKGRLQKDNEYYVCTWEI